MGNLLGNESGKLTSLMTPRLTHDDLAPAHAMVHIHEAASRLFGQGMPCWLTGRVAICNRSDSLAFRPSTITCSGNE
jgi:hypothetical protein